MNFVACFMWILLIAIIFTSFVDLDPYMDEIFHIPQSTKYCHHIFTEWDNKITTFPGLYIFSFLTHQILGSLGFALECSTSFMRISNFLLASTLPFLLFGCRKQIIKEDYDSLLTSSILFTLPFSFFYYFLYYTDTASTMSLLWVFWFSNSINVKTLDQKPINLNCLIEFTAAHISLLLVSCFSILTRQTNAVWLLFFVGIKMLKILEDHTELKKNFNFSVFHIVEFISELWKNKVLLLLNTWSLLLPVGFFVVFVFQNGGIVLGDKENHKPVCHPAMLVYCLFFSSLFISPVLVTLWLKSHTNVIQKEKEKTRNIILNSSLAFLILSILIISLVVTLALVYGSHSHPFLLSDNRHYSFYLWKRILQFSSNRLLLSPLISLFVISTISYLMESQGLIWVLIYLVAVSITLLPTPLLEFRYFTPGIIFAVLHMPSIGHSTISTAAAVFCILTNLSINAITIYVFIQKPFLWPDGSTARFIY